MLILKKCSNSKLYSSLNTKPFGNNPQSDIYDDVMMTESNKDE